MFIFGQCGDMKFIWNNSYAEIIVNKICFWKEKVGVTERPRSFTFSSPEPTILLACGRNRELWEQPFQACALDADYVRPDGQNRPFPSSHVPLFQSESKCETILVEMTLIWMRMKLHAELIFIWKVSHLDSFSKRGTENSEMAYSVISFVISKWLLLELSIPVAGQKDGRLWGREWPYHCSF